MAHEYLADEGPIQEVWHTNTPYRGEWNMRSLHRGTEDEEPPCTPHVTPPKLRVASQRSLGLRVIHIVLRWLSRMCTLLADGTSSSAAATSQAQPHPRSYLTISLTLHSRGHEALKGHFPSYCPAWELLASPWRAMPPSSVHHGLGYS